jgi:prepilin-type processing-associated H-X9-DG protein
MSKVIRYVLLGLVVLFLAGLILPIIMHSRTKSDRIVCQNHLREIGLFGVRHASPPGEAIPLQTRSDLPPGTFLNPVLPPEQRMSWYVYMLNVINEGAPSMDENDKHRPPAGLADALKSFEPKGTWDSPGNATLANYRLTAAICPAQYSGLVAGNPSPSHYIAVGGLGLTTPGLSIEEAGANAGAYRYDGPTPDRLIADGLSQTAQFVETNLDIGPWLRGGPSTLRGLDVAAEPYLGIGRPFGGCHPGGAYVSMVDGSVQFIRETIDPKVFLAMLTRAGGENEVNLESP